MGAVCAAVILGCNEDNVLARCVESLSGVAELYISVDENSTDQTEALARQFTPHVYRHNLAALDSFSAARNGLQDEAEKVSQLDWFLWIDPDEWLAEGKEGLGSLLAQADAQGKAGLMVRMVDIPAEAEPGVRGATWQNCKFFKRGQRFARRRHEHLPVSIQRAVCPQVAINHQKLQRPEVQTACGQIKTNLPALLADYAEFQDQRAAYYVGDGFLQANDAQTALNWFEKGLTHLDSILGARSQLYAGLFAAHRLLGNWDEAHRAAHDRWACDYRDGRDCAWQVGSLAVDTDNLDEAEYYFKMVLSMPEAQSGLNQVLSGSPTELAHYGLSVVYAKQGKLTEANQHLRAAERFGPRPEYVLLRTQIVKAVS